MTKLAALITYHNEGELLTECLRSVAGQVDEILVYDDASRLPARDYIPNDIPVQLIIGTENVGPSVGRNILWRAARSTFVHFHDADDLFTPEWGTKIREQLNDEVQAVFTEVRSLREGELVSEHAVELAVLNGSTQAADLVRFCLEHTMLVPCGTYRRDFIEAVGGYDETMWQSEDFEFHVRLACRITHFRVLLHPLVTIRLRTESRSTHRHEVWEGRLHALQRAALYLPREFAQELSEVCRRTGSELFRMRERRLAGDAFRLARRMGTPRFLDEQGIYRTVANHLGVETAEWMGMLYRGVLPDPLRKRIRDFVIRRKH